MLKTTSKNETNIKSNFDLSEELKLISKNEYRSVLRKYVPGEDFCPDNKELLRYFIFMSLYLFGAYSIINLQLLPVKTLISIFMGISLAALTFFMHDLMHGAVVKSKKITYVLGLSIGLLNFFAPLFWQRTHNFHHARAGNIDDPDRMYIWTEKPQNAFEKFIYKLRISRDSYNTFFSLIGMSFGFFWYFLTMFYALFQKKIRGSQYQGINKLFKTKEVFIVFGELLLIFSFQGFLFCTVAKYNFFNYFLVSLLPVLIAHFTTMLYIHTNHFLSPLTLKVDDPLINSLSLKNSWLVDKVFSNFSHHVEHHLFPAMSSSHYPKIRKLLLDLYPNRFQLIPMTHAVKLLCTTPRIYSDNIHLVNHDGREKFNCLLPNT